MNPIVHEAESRGGKSAKDRSVVMGPGVRRNDIGRYAVAASTSSKSSSKGAKVDSGLVDSVIGLRLP